MASALTVREQVVEAAVVTLGKYGPLHYKDLYNLIVQDLQFECNGKDAAYTCYAHLFYAIKNYSETRIVFAGNGVYALKTQADATVINTKALAPHLKNAGNNSNKLLREVIKANFSQCNETEIQYAINILQQELKTRTANTTK